MIELEELQHTFGQRINGVDRCPLCPGEHSGPGTCDHTRSSRKRRRFDLVPFHREEILNALINPDRSAASAVRERQNEEYRSLPPGHICSCVCPNVLHGRRSCDECRRLHENEVPRVTIEIGRTAVIHAPMPDAAILDLMLGML